MTIANQILEQLGGRMFILMTGSKNFTDCGNALQMHLTRNQMKAKYLTIELTPMDTYKMTFSTVNKNMELVILDEIDDTKAEAVLNYLEKRNLGMKRFCQFIFYSFARPIEICRLKISDINFEQKIL